MALRAIYNSQYIKSGRKMYVYAVTGPTTEVEKYIAVQEAQSGKAAGTWNKNEAGQPLYFLNVSLELQNGRTPQPTMNLIFSQDSTRVIIDRSAEEQAKYKRINDLKDQSMATILAELELGIRQPVVQGTSFATPARTTTPAAAPIAEAPDLAETIMSQVGAGGEGDLGDGAGEAGEAGGEPTA